MNTKHFKKIILNIVLLTMSTVSYSQSPILSENAKVSVLTCGTGNESYSLFGHTAIRITDAPNFIDLVYNYGAFDFNTPNFVPKFVKGDLQYFAVAHAFHDFINEYQYEKRAVYEQELNIPSAKKQQLFENLNTALASGDSHYTYKFIDKNCTSMVVDIINKTLNTTAIVKNTDTTLTYRTILYPYFDHHFYEQLGTSIIFGKKVDELGTRIFLPFELLTSLKTVQYKNHPLAQEPKILLTANEITPHSWWNNPYSYLLFLAFIIIIHKKRVNIFYFITMGILGVFFIGVGFYSFHHELSANYNAFLFNPTLLLLAYYYVKNNQKGILNWAVFNLFSLTIYLLLLINKAHLLIVTPLIFTSGLILVRLVMKNKRSTDLK